MRNKTKLLAAGGAAALLALGGLAGLAHAGKDGWGGGWGRGGHGMMGQEMMQRYDADKDGKVTQPEIDQNRTQWHGQFDADKNASLSLEEFTALWLKAKNEMIVREFQFFDRDGNGQVTLDEYRLPMQDMVAMRDRNGDGALSRDDRGRGGKHGGGHHRWKDGGGDGEGMGQGMGQGMGGGNAPGAEPPAPANP